MPKKDYTVREASLGPQSPIRLLLDYDRFIWTHTAQMPKKTIQPPTSNYEGKPSSDIAPLRGTWCHHRAYMIGRVGYTLYIVKFKLFIYGLSYDI
jgi:hypothetical protein